MINENTGSGNEKVGLKKSKKEKKEKIFEKGQTHVSFFTISFQIHPRIYFQTIAWWSLEYSFCPHSGLQRKSDLKMNSHSNLYLLYLDMFARTTLGAFISLLLSAALFVCMCKH